MCCVCVCAVCVYAVCVCCVCCVCAVCAVCTLKGVVCQWYWWGYTALIQVFDFNNFSVLINSKSILLSPKPQKFSHAFVPALS